MNTNVSEELYMQLNLKVKNSIIDIVHTRSLVVLA